VDADDAARAVRRLRSYAVNAPPSLRFAKQLLTENGTESDLALVQRRELAALELAYATPEHREAIAAFFEKRDPKFR
jgi:enoyl-CoA hydratase/carnithine racemase